VNDIAVGLKQGRGAAGMLLRDDEFANQLRRTVTTTASNVDDIVAGVKSGHGAVGMLLRDETLEGEIRGVIKNAQQATVDLNHASHRVDALVSDLNSHQIPKKADEVIASLNESARQVNQMISEINQPDHQGLSAGANIRESLANANVATLNLADETEALKHNFFLRGSFDAGAITTWTGSRRNSTGGIPPSPAAPTIVCGYRDLICSTEARWPGGTLRTRERALE